MSSRRQKLTARVHWCLQSSLKHITEWIKGNTDRFADRFHCMWPVFVTFYLTGLLTLHLSVSVYIYIHTRQHKVNATLLYSALRVWYTCDVRTSLVYIYTWFSSMEMLVVLILCKCTQCVNSYLRCWAIGLSSWKHTLSMFQSCPVWTSKNLNDRQKKIYTTYALFHILLQI